MLIYNLTWMFRQHITSYIALKYEMIFFSYIGKPKPNRYNVTLGITDLTGIEFSTIVIAYPEPYYLLENENGTTNNRMMASIARNAINNFTIYFNQTNVQQSDYGTYFLKLKNSFGTATVSINVLPQSK